jgi:hypothetical protein
LHVSGDLIGKIEKAARWPSRDLAHGIDQALETGGELAGLWPQVQRYRESLGADLVRPTGQGWMARPDTDRDSSSQSGLGESVRRRHLGGLVAAVTACTVLDSAVPGIDRLVSHLTGYPFAVEPELSKPVWTLTRARAAVARSKRDYQAGRYSKVFDQVSALLTRLRALVATRASEEVAAAWVLLADAYHVAGSVLLKIDDVGLATLAADRAMAAAQRSGDPVAIAASARVVTHALISGGHPGQGHRTAAGHAARLLSQAPSGTEATSVAGALMLRGAIAAARCGDHGGAHDLLDEAADAARSVPEGGNSRWTAFDAINVQLHRVHVALVLGDPDAAVALAGQVDLSRVELAERRACLYLDLAQAHAERREWNDVVAALHRAALTAPQEVRSRSSVRRLVAHVYRAGPRSVRSQVRDLAAITGTPL